MCRRTARAHSRFTSEVISEPSRAVAFGREALPSRVSSNPRRVDERSGLLGESLGLDLGGVSYKQRPTDVGLERVLPLLDLRRRQVGLGLPEVLEPGENADAASLDITTRRLDWASVLSPERPEACLARDDELADHSECFLGPVPEDEAHPLDVEAQVSVSDGDAHGRQPPSVSVAS